jgi:hypothetical protein
VADAGDDWGRVVTWYPEVAAAGGACRAGQDEFDRRGAGVRVRAREGESSRRAATVGDGGRHADLRLSVRERRFYLALRGGRTTLLQGYAGDLPMTAGAAWRWLSGEPAGRVAAAWPFLGSVALAEARERGDRREASWLWLYENHCGDAVAARLASFLALAFREPRLRALRPYTSHWALSFSRTPQWPFSRDCPVVEPAVTSGRYVVHARDGRIFDETDAAGALRIVLAELPG